MTASTDRPGRGIVRLRGSLDFAAARELRERWSQRHAGDPFYNAGYRADRGDFSRRTG